MNTIEPDKNDEALDRLLRHWEVKTSLPPGFHRQVWSRIEQSRRQHGFGVFAWFVNQIESAFLRPAVALVYVMLILLTGSAFGWSQARKDREQLGEALGQRYVRAIDPYQRLR